MNSSTKLFSKLGLLALSLGTFTSAYAARYIVRMNSPAAFQQASDSLRDALRHGISGSFGSAGSQARQPRLLNTDARIIDSLDNLNMVIVDSDDVSIEAIANSPEVAYVEKEVIFAAPRLPVGTGTMGNSATRRRRNAIADSEITWGLRAIHADTAWTATIAGAQGQGARVLVIDTGIDRDHADLRDNFEQGKNFLSSTITDPDTDASNTLPGMTSFFRGVSNVFADAAADADINNTAAAYDYWDQVGHGSHVAGTIAGVGNGVGVVGVAPKAKILAGRVCGKLGCSSLAIVNAINWSVTQHVDVVNMSLGGPTPSRAQEDALNAAKAGNVVLVAAAGNEGTATVGYPAKYESVLSVGAVDETLTRAEFSQYGPELDVAAPGVNVISSVPTGSGREALTHITLDGVTSEVKSTSFVGAKEIDTPFTGDLVYAGLGKPTDFTAAVRGKIALIQRGEIPFADKVKAAIAAGAVGAVIYNNAPGLISGALTQDGSTLAIGVVMIEQTLGEAIKAKLDAAQAASVTMVTLKTDYAPFQGTSMASPHVAGVAALVRASNKHLTVDQVINLIKTTVAAKPTPNNEYGTGIVDAQAAVRAAVQAP